MRDCAFDVYKEISYLMKNIPIKKLLAAVLAAGTLAGAVFIATDYADGSNFHPFKSSRALLANQVFFPDNDNTASYNGTDKTEDDNSFWEEDKSSEQTDRPESQNDAGYLFEQSSLMYHDDSMMGSLASPDAQNASAIADGSNAGRVFDITGDRTNADMIISGSGSGTGEKTRVTDAQGAGSDSRGSIIGGSRGGSGSVGGSGGGAAAGGNAGSDVSGGGSAETPDVPDNGNISGGSGSSDTPSSTAKDPVPDKNNPDSIGFIHNEPYDENIIYDRINNPDNPDASVIISEPLDIKTTAIYLGQTVDKKTIFQALNTYVWGHFGDNTYRYLWGDNEYERYIRIRAVSFDGGKSWTDEFPLVIPNTIDPNGFRIKTEYRLRERDNWTERNVTYRVRQSRIYILSERINDYDAVIDPTKILNNYSQYSDSTLFNLYGNEAILRYFNGYNGMAISELFPGWTENGKAVPWLYPVTAGRHILEPADSIPIDDAYTVSLRMYWINDDYEIKISEGYDPQYKNLSYLQTLTGYTKSQPDLLETLIACFAGEKSETLEVPEHIQAVDIDNYSPIETDSINIPESTIYINTASAALKVKNEYNVSDDNKIYSSDHGILYDKAKTKILGIPYDVTEISVPENITEINLPENNNIRTINIETTDTNKIPKINGNVKNCTFLLDNNLFASFFADHRNDLLLTENGNLAADKDMPDITYKLVNGAVVSSDGVVFLMLDIGIPSFKAGEDIKSISGGAFAGVWSTDTIILPESGTIVEFEQGSLLLSGIKNIVCSSKEQYDYINEILALKVRNDVDGKYYPWTGLTSDDVNVVWADTSKEGYRYNIDIVGDDEIVTLLSVPADIREFEGVITADDGKTLTVNRIGDYAFSSAKKLEWVVLDEPACYIGYRAFYGCEALQGIFIANKDTITIGDEAFDECDSLRFIASNAPHAIYTNEDYDPVIDDEYGNADIRNRYYFVLPESTGYGSNVNSLLNFNDAPDFIRFELYKVSNAKSDADSRILYVVYKGNDNTEKRVALRSGKTVPDRVTFADGVTAIYPYAFADTVSEQNDGQGYTVDWDSLNELSVLNTGAFRNSELSGDVVLGHSKSEGFDINNNCLQETKIRNVYINATVNKLGGDGVFWGCTELETVSFGDFGTDVGINYGLFTDCGKLKTIEFKGSLPKLVLLGRSTDLSTSFRFDMDREPEYGDSLHLIIPESKYADTAPERFENAVKDIIKQWRYTFIGYYTDDQITYNGYWSDVKWDHFWDMLTDEEITAIVNDNLTAGENRLRSLLGANEVSEPTDIYPIRVIDDMWYLTGVPSYTKEITLDWETLEHPEGIIDYIASGTFEKCRELTSVKIPSYYSIGQTLDISGLEPNAFYINDYEGILNVELESIIPPELMLKSIYDKSDSDTDDPFGPGGWGDFDFFGLFGAEDDEGSDTQKIDVTPYEFGLDDDQLCFIVPSGREMAYLGKWMYPLLGYKDAGSMYDKIKAGALLKDDYHIVEEMSSELTEPAVRLSRMIEGIDPDSIDQDKLKELICDDLGIDVPEEAPEATSSDYPRATETEYQEPETETEEAAEAADVEKDKNSSDKEASDKDSTGTDSDKSDKDTSYTDGTVSDKADKSDNSGEGGKNETTSDADYAESDAKGASGEISSDTDDTIEDSASKDTADIIAKETLTGKNGSSKNKDIGSSDENVIEKIASFISGELRKLSKLCA